MLSTIGNWRRTDGSRYCSPLVVQRLPKVLIDHDWVRNDRHRPVKDKKSLGTTPCVLRYINRSLVSCFRFYFPSSVWTCKLKVIWRVTEMIGNISRARGMNCFDRLIWLMLSWSKYGKSLTALIPTVGWWLFHRELLFRQLHYQRLTLVDIKWSRFLDGE